MTDAQEAMALPGVNRNLANYEALRKIEVPLDLASGWTIDGSPDLQRTYALGFLVNEDFGPINGSIYLDDFNLVEKGPSIDVATAPIETIVERLAKRQFMGLWAARNKTSGLIPNSSNNVAIGALNTTTGVVWNLPADAAFPFVLTTYRLTEHHTAGAMTRWTSWLSELQPEAFVELSPELAAERRIEHGGWVTVVTARGEARARALVTRRLRPLRLDGRTVHQVGFPWHFGYEGLVRGSAANELVALVGEPNVSIHEAKVLTCDIRPGRGPEGTR